MREVVKFTLLALIFIFFLQTAIGQKIAFTTLSVENGLSQNSALSIAQDNRGFIWVGTRDGLNKYDTRGFTVYKNNPSNKNSISDSYLLSLLGDSQGVLWAGTLNGLNRYNPEHDNFERITNLTNDTISVIYEDTKHRLWIGTENGLNLLVDREHNEFKHLFCNNSAQTRIGFKVHSIYEDHEGTLWVGTSTGLLKINGQNDSYRYQLFKHEINKPKSLSGDFITSILEDFQQRLWIGTQYNGLQRFNKTDTSFSHFVHNDADPTSLINDNIRKLILDKTGKIWIGTQDGLSIMDPSDKTFTSYQHDPEDKSSISQNSIHSIFKDTNGTMWIGTYFGGVDVAYSNAFTLYQNNRSSKSISNNVISSIVEDRHHNFWIGTEGGGLNYLYRQSGNFISYKNIPKDTTSLPSNLVKLVYIDKSGNVWAGVHGGGLCLFDSAKGRFKQFINVEQQNKDVTDVSEIITMLEDSHGRLWVGSLNGLTYVDNRDGYFRKHTKPAPFNLPVTNVHYLFEDIQKNLWIGTSAGLFKLADSAKQPIPFVENVKGKTVSTQPFVNCIFQDSKGRIWIGTQLGGIGLCDLATKHITYFTEKDGLANNNVMGILEAPNGDLWISTNNGLSRFNINKKHFKTYTSGDGLAGNQFNYNAFFKDSKGKFFFGGYNGISSFYPDKIESNDYISPVVFTGLKLFNQPIAINGPDGLLQKDISLTQNILLHYNQNVFTVDFALLNFIKNSKNKYAYKLDGFDKDWNETNTPSAAYTNLSPGEYTFWAKGANNDGVWSQPISLKIQILPPYWRTWWAYGIYVLLLVLLVFLISRFFFLRALLVREDELHQVKLNFFTNISHEIRTHLTLIMAPVDKLLDEKQDDATKQQLSNVKNNANRLLKLVSELMDFRKAETNHLQLNVDRYNLVEFVENIYTSFRDLALSKKINISFIHNTENAPLYFDAEQLEKVFFNLITNAFKFTPGGGNIVVELQQRADTTTVSVTDNGRGIAPEYLDKLFTNFFQVLDHGKQNTGYGIGLALTKHIVELHHGYITVNSEPAMDYKEGKTTFTVVLQQGYQHFEYDKNVTIHAIGNHLHTTETFLQPILPPAENEQNSEIQNTGTKPFTILITEDNADLRQLVRETLEPTYNILLAENGLEGWQKATEQIPDLIVSDVMMPEMNGFTLCKKLKTDERTSHIPVILLTAKSSQNDQVSGLETGADSYLTKPFSTKILELNVRNLLASRERMRQRFSQQINIAPLVKTEADTILEPILVKIIEPAYLNPIDQEFLDKLIQLVEANIDDPDFGVALISKKVAMSPPILYKKLKAVTNMSVNDFVKSLRFKKAAALLREKQFTDYDVAAAVGYYDRKYFNKEFKRLFGVSPKEYAEG